MVSFQKLFISWTKQYAGSRQMRNEKKICILLIFFIFKASAINFKEWVTVNTDYKTKNYDITYYASNFQQEWALSAYAKLAEPVIKAPTQEINVW